MTVYDPARDRGIREITALRGGMLPRQAGEVVEQHGEWYRLTEVVVRLPSLMEREMWQWVDYVEVATLQPLDHFGRGWHPDAASTAVSEPPEAPSPHE